MATHQDKSTNPSAQSGGAIPGAAPDIADAFAKTRLLIIAASNLAGEMDDTAAYALGSVLGAAEEKFTIALDWYEAAAWKASVEERKAASEPIAARHEPVHVDVVDDINAARYLVECAWMAAAHLDLEERDAMQAVLAIAQDKLEAVRDRCNVARGAQCADTAGDPVFAAIARHKMTWAAYVTATCELSVDELGAYRKSHTEDDEALEAFLETTPTTLPGLRAALEYVVAIDSGSIPDNGGRIAPALLKSPVFA